LFSDRLDVVAAAMDAVEDFGLSNDQNLWMIFGLVT
jgi:hypothetical protein